MKNFVTDFGGVTSGGGSCNAQLAAAWASGENVLFPSGAYRIDNPCWLIGKGASFIGANRYTTTFIYSNPNEVGLQLGGGIGFPSVHHGSIENFQFIPMGTPSVPTSTILLRNVKNFFLKECWIREHATAIKIGEVGDGLAASCEDIHIEGVKSDPGYGVSGPVIDIANVNGLWIERGCNLSGRGNQVGYLFSNQGAVTIDTVTIIGSLMKDCLTALRAGAGTVSNVQILGGYYDMCQSVGIHLETVPNVELNRWTLNTPWINSNNYGIIASTSGGGHIRDLKIIAPTIGAPNSMAIQGPNTYSRLIV